MDDKQLIGLAKYSAKKRKEALIRTEIAIKNLANKQQKITVRSVAREAQVSISYIYKYPELAYKIQRLREQQKYNLIISTQGGQKVEDQRKLEEVKLKQENADLKAIIATEKSEIDNYDNSKELQKLKIENIQLVTENLRLKQELEYTLKSLQSAREFILEQKQVNQQEK